MSTHSDYKLLSLIRKNEALKIPNLEGSWKYKVTVFRRNNELAVPDFNSLITSETDVVIKQQDDFLYLELPPDLTRPVSGTLLGIVSKERSNPILGQEKIKLNFVDFDDNGIFSLKDTKTDSNGNIVELKGTYLESGFFGTTSQLQTVGKVSLTKILL